MRRQTGRPVAAPFRGRASRPSAHCASFVSKWVRAWGFATMRNLRRCGWSLSPCWSGTMRHSCFYAMHHPFTSPKFEDLGLIRHRSGQGTGQCLRLRSKRRRSGRRFDPYFRLGITAQDVRSTRLQRRIGRRTVRVPDECVQIRRTAPRRHRFRLRPPLCIVRRRRIRSAITSAFPKNNSGRDMMIDSPSEISDEQLKELAIAVKK